MYPRLEALKVTLDNFNDVKKAVEKSTNLEEIGEIFRFVFARFTNMAFTVESAQAYDTLKSVLERLAAMPQVSAKGLHDLSEFSTRLYSYDIINAIKEDFPEYADLFEQAQKIQPDQLKREVIQDGKNLMQEKFANVIEDIKTLHEDINFVDVARGKIRDDQFIEAKNFINKKIAEEIEKEFPGEGDSTKRLIDRSIIDPESWGEKNIPILKRYIELRQKVAIECKDKFKEYAELVEEVEKRNERAKILKQKIFDDVSNSLKDSSGISQEEAEAWANNNVYLEKGIERKLNAIGYPKKKLLQDIADFYRYAGGKLGPVEFIMTRRTRAFALTNKMQIAVTKYFNTETLFHECGHLVEGLDDLSLKCSYQFRNDRATGKIQSLRSLTGNSGYSSEEVAYPDNFINPYVGKVYQWPASEVYSMAIENIASPDQIINFIENDPEHFNLFLGVCLHKNPELAERINKIAEIAAERYKKIVDTERNQKQWHDTIYKAIKPIEDNLVKLLTSSDYYEGFKLVIWRNMAELEYHIDENIKCTVYYGAKKKAVAVAYFAILSKRKLIPIEFEPENRSFKNAISNCIDSTTPPTWYDEEKGLPILDLGDKGSNLTESYNKWMTELKKKTPSNMLDLLKQEEGICGYTISRIPDSANKKIYLYYDKYKWVARERVALIPYIAYLLIAFDKGLLEGYSSLYRSTAAHDFQNLLTKKLVPDWFNPDKGLPELSL